MKLKIAYLLSIILFSVLNVVIFFQSINSLLILSKNKFLDNISPGDLREIYAFIILLSIGAVILNIIVLRKYKKENIRNILVLSGIDLAIIPLSVLIVILWKNTTVVDSTFIPTSKLFNLPIILMLVMVKQIGIGYFFSPDHKRDLTNKSLEDEQ
jgi:amino acid transporter